MAEIHEEEVLEDVSLCDLPISTISLSPPEEEEERQQQMLNNSNERAAAAEPEEEEEEEEEEFAFGPTITGDPVCAADDVFHDGLIVPLRPSSASFAGLSNSNSNSSRSSSSCSSSSRSSSSRNRNRFQAHHPSPKPHFRGSTGRSKSATMERAGSLKPKSNNSVWDFFRVGLVRTPPELELQDLKVSILRSNSRPNNNNNNNNKGGGAEKPKMTRIKFLGGGCKCSAEAVDSDALISSVNHDHKAKLLESDYNKKSYGRHDKHYRDDDGDREKQEKHSSKDHGRRKQAVSHHRTYEWLKELSHANLVMHV